MRALFTLVYFLLLTACMTTTAPHNDYDHYVKSWVGSNRQALVAHWGMPNQLIHSPDSHSYYVYSTESTLRLPSSDNSRNAIVVNKRSTTISPGIESYSPNYTVVHCTTTFELNRKNIVVGSTYYGGDCSLTSRNSGNSY